MSAVSPLAEAFNWFIKTANKWPLIYPLTSPLMFALYLSTTLLVSARHFSLLVLFSAFQMCFLLSQNALIIQLIDSHDMLPYPCWTPYPNLSDCWSLPDLLHTIKMLLLWKHLQFTSQNLLFSPVSHNTSHILC